MKKNSFSAFTVTYAPPAGGVGDICTTSTARAVLIATFTVTYYYSTEQYLHFCNDAFVHIGRLQEAPRHTTRFQ